MRSVVVSENQTCYVRGDNVPNDPRTHRIFILNTRYISRERRTRATLWPPATRSRLGKLDARGAEGCIARRRRRFPARARLAFGAALWEAVERLLEERGTKRDELPVVLDEPRVVLHKVGRRLGRVRPRLQLWLRTRAGAGAGAWAGAGAGWGWLGLGLRLAGAELSTLSARELVSCEWGTGRCVQPKRLLSTQADSLRRDVIPTKRYLHSKCRIAHRRCAGPAPHAARCNINISTNTDTNA